MKTIRVNVSIPEDLLAEVDVFVKDHAMTRSGLIQLSLTQYMQAQAALPNLNRFFALLGSLAQRATTEGGVSSDEYAAELAALQEYQNGFQNGLLGNKPAGEVKA